MKIPLFPRQTAFAEECLIKIKRILSTPRPMGNYWAHEVMAKVERGEHVSVAGYLLAKKALAKEPQREPGSDDE